MPLITAAQLARVASKAVPHVVNAIVDHADDVLPRYGIVTPLRVQHFLAQVLVETGYLRHLEEGLSYSAERAHEVWPRRFPTVASAEPYAHQPERLANLVYAGRMGNPHPGDGWAHRGLGLLMNTGGDGRARLAKALHVERDAVSAMLTDPRWMLECAAADFVALGCLPYADRDDPVGVTRRVNGGTIGLADRRAALALCRKVWPRVAPPVRAKPIPSPSPAIPPAVLPDPKDPKPVKAAHPLIAGFVALLLSAVGAHAEAVAVSPAVNDAIGYLVVPALLAVVSGGSVGATLVMPLKRFIDQKTADVLAKRVDDLLKKAIAYGAKRAEDYVERSDFHLNVDGWVQELAAKYAVAHAPALLKQAGGDLSEKIQARLSSHEDVLALKASVPAASAA